MLKVGTRVRTTAYTFSSTTGVEIPVGSIGTVVAGTNPFFNEVDIDNIPIPISIQGDIPHWLYLDRELEEIKPIRYRVTNPNAGTESGFVGLELELLRSHPKNDTWSRDETLYEFECPEKFEKYSCSEFEGKKTLLFWESEIEVINE